MRPCRLKELDEIAAGFEEIRENGAALWERYRSGIKSCRGAFEKKFASYAQKIDRCRKELVKQVKKVKPNTRFIMISKVQDSEMRAKAYQAGIEFFINKPINLIEVKAVLGKVEQSLKMASQLSSISQMVNNFNQQTDAPLQTSQTDQADATLKYLGMNSEKGTTDILQVVF